MSPRRVFGLPGKWEPGSYRKCWHLPSPGSDFSKLVPERRTTQCSSALVGIRKRFQRPLMLCDYAKEERRLIPVVSPDLWSSLQGRAYTRYALLFRAAKMFGTLGDLLQCHWVKNVFSQYSQTFRHPLMLCDHAKGDGSLPPLGPPHLRSPLQGCSCIRSVLLFGAAKMSGTRGDLYQCRWAKNNFSQ